MRLRVRGQRHYDTITDCSNPCTARERIIRILSHEECLIASHVRGFALGRHTDISNYAGCSPMSISQNTLVISNAAAACTSIYHIIYHVLKQVQVAPLMLRHLITLIFLILFLHPGPYWVSQICIGIRFLAV